MNGERSRPLLELKEETDNHSDLLFQFHNIKTPSSISHPFTYGGQFQRQCFPCTYKYNTPFGPFLITRPLLHPLQIESKKLHCHCQIDLDTIVRAEDRRTTLIITNIPNKYVSKMLLYEIEENHQGTYDFLYLPIDYKNNGNLGYAIINMLSHLHIVSFYKAFHGKKWDTVFGKQVISLEYAWIQGKDTLVTHFQNSGCICELCFSRRWPISFVNEA